jgi:SAM-dependent methyltransferase
VIRKLYTLNHNRSVLQKITEDEKQLTAEEALYISEYENDSDVYKSKEAMLRKYLPENLSRFPILEFLIDIIKRQKYRNILSMGSGSCVIEYLLKLCLPEELNVVCCDFNQFLVRKTQKLFPELNVFEFNFFEDNIADIFLESKIEFDMVIFFGSAFVMDNDKFVKLFSDLKRMPSSFHGRHIIDFHAGYIDFKRVVAELLCPSLIYNTNIRRLLGKDPAPKSYLFGKETINFNGKFIGYSRSRNELRKLYKLSGWNIKNEMSFSWYKYTAILE